MRTIILLLTTLFISLNCIGKKVPKNIRERFTNRYDAKNTNIRSLIEIDGYYVLKNIGRWCSGWPSVCHDTFEYNMVFYEDGSFLYNFFEKGAGYPGNTLRYLENVTKGIDTESFNEGFYWGIYRIEGDTIIAQYLNHAEYWKTWFGSEYRYKVVDRRTIKFLPTETRSIEKRTKQEEKQMAEEWAKAKYLPAEFKPSPYMPTPNSWLKRQDWVHRK